MIEKLKKNKMKFKISLLIITFLLTATAIAQVDRSKMPEPGPAPEISIEQPKEFKLGNGLTVMVVENHKLPRVSFSLDIENKPIANGDKAGVASLLGSMLGNGTSTIPKDEFNEEVDFLGSRINIGSDGAFASGLSKYSERILELMADAAINPLLVEEEFKKEKAKLIEGIKGNQKNVAAAADAVGRALSYGKNHPYGEFTTVSSVENVTFEDVRSHYETYFNPNNAYLVVIGDVEYESIKNQLEKTFGQWKNAALVDYSVQNSAPNVQYTQINFVDMPNAVQSNIIATNNVDLKMNDEDYHAALITNFILGGGADGYLYKNLRETNGYTYGSYSNLGSNKYGEARFTATAEVRNEVTDSSVVEILNEIKRLRTETVDEETLNLAKAKYVGNFVMALENPQTIARYALNIKQNELPQNFYKTYLEKINAVTAEDVKRVANKYMNVDNMRVVVVGKGSEVLVNLEKLDIPVKYFDKYANQVEKPVFSKPIPEGVNAERVINDYVKSVGGKENLEKINSLMTLADVTIEGMPFQPKSVMKSMAPNKSSMEMSIEGMGVVMKQKFDGESGYQEQQGQRVPMSEKEITAKKAEKGLFPELYLDASNLELESITSIDESDVYKVKVTLGDDVSHRYYSTDTNFLVREESTTEAQGQTITSVVDYSDYNEVEGVMIPFTQKVTAGPQIITMKTSEVKINEGVSEEDFK